MRRKSIFVAAILGLFVVSPSVFAAEIVAWGHHSPSYPQVFDVPEPNDYIDISTGGYFGLALKSDGSIEAWGRNIDGECNVPSGYDFFAISIYNQFNLALATYQNIHCSEKYELLV